MARGQRGRGGGRADPARGVPEHIDPADVQLWVHRGLVRGDAGDLEASSADFSKAIELEPKHAEAHLHRATISVRMARRDGVPPAKRAALLEAAKADALRSVELAPRDWRGREHAEALLEEIRARGK